MQSSQASPSGRGEAGGGSAGGAAGAGISSNGRQNGASTPAPSTWEVTAAKIDAQEDFNAPPEPGPGTA